jgi:hypothetical protein
LVAVVKPTKVAQSLGRLRELGVHPHFVGYLCIKQLATTVGSQTELQPDFKRFHETFLKIHNHPPETPYLRIFVNQTPSNKNLFLNSNIAGSYAPSSIRENFRKVITITGANREARYALNSQHWVFAKQYLCRGKEIPVVELAAVLYRDYAITTNEPSLKDLVDIFKEEFGYLESSAGSTVGGNHEFEALYIDESAALNSSEWLDEVDDG